MEHTVTHFWLLLSVVEKAFGGSFLCSDADRKLLGNLLRSDILNLRKAGPYLANSYLLNAGNSGPRPV